MRLPDLLMERDELAATERSNAKILKKRARYEILVLDEWLTEDVNDVDISFPFELIERRYATKSTALCTQHTPAGWHGRLGGGVQADAMADRPVHGSARIDLGDANARKLLADRKQRYASAKRMTPKRRERRYASPETGGAHAA